MKVYKSPGIIVCSIVFVWGFFTSTTLNATEAMEASKEAKAIEVDASLSDNHPAIEEGVTCADCHEIKLDANTTETQVWLTGNYAGFSPNEGVVPGSDGQGKQLNKSPRKQFL